MRPTDRQREAIEAPFGPVLVVAGPGAGKTYCLIGRVHHLVKKTRLPPSGICAVTFTNKAAEEVEGRLRETLGHAARDVTTGTLHALCLAVLRDHAEAAGLKPGFGIADEGYQDLVLRKLGVWVKRRPHLLTLFGRRRIEAYTLTDDDEALFLRYVAHLRERNLADFDDIIVLTAQLFKRHEAIADAVAARWHYILVDEFQDLDPVQYAIIKRLGAPHRNLFVVGDDEQSIFSWRGADPGVLARFQMEFRIAQPIILDRNRRCSQQIFEVARRLLAHTPGLFDKQLRAERTSPHPVQAHVFDDEGAEADWIVADLGADRQVSGRSWGEYAVLYRRHQAGTALERRFVQANMPCRMAQRRSLQDDPAIGHVIAALRVMSRPGDPLAIEAFAEQVLPDSLLERLRSDQQRDEGTGDLLAAARGFARQSPRADPDTKRAWRFVYHVENILGLAQAHTSLRTVVTELLSQRVGKYRNALEDLDEELTDPAAHPAAVQLAERLYGAASGDGRVWVAPSGGGGVAIALRGMLLGAGFANAGYVTPETNLGLADAVVDTDPLTLFKALQLVHTRDLADVFRTYVAFDLETTDRDPATCDIIEIGAARVVDGVVVEQFHHLVRPAAPISAGAREAHGYSDADLAGAPSFPDVWPTFRAFVAGDLLVAHNGQRFDVPVLRRAAAGLEGVDRLVFFDTLPLARSLSRDSAKLGDLAQRFGLNPGRSHHALDDAVTLAGVVSVLGRRRVERARKAALVNVLDYLGLGLALEPGPDTLGERKTLLDAARPFALGRYSDCLEFYQSERDRVGLDAPALEGVIERLGGAKLLARLRAAPDPARRYPAAMARLDALIEASRADTLEASVRRFLEQVTLSTSEGAEVDPHRVSLLTLHATKGLEFACVYVVGVEDHQLPGWYPLKENRKSEIDEARRLLYVGMTRAKDRLVLTRARRRLGEDAGGNRFLDDMSLTPIPSDPVSSPEDRS